MRSTKLVPALAAMATVLAVAPAGASAAHHPSLKRHRHALGVHAGICHLSLNAAPRFIESGESAVAFGTLACVGGTSVANQTVTVMQSSAGTPGVSTTGTATTDTTGHYQLATPALLTNSEFQATALGAQSGRRAVKVSPKVSLSGPADGSQLFTGGGPFFRSHTLSSALRNRVTFAGTVSPTDAGAIVALQRENAVGGEEWHRIGLGEVGKDGSYSIPHTFEIPGEANIRVVVRAHTLNSRGASESLSYEISQAQNPALTIHSSADPVFYGQPTTITGTIESPTSTPVTLLERTRLQSSYVPVAVAISSGGAYSFTAQVPLQSTAYEVTGGGKASARLFEGVKYGLTATASSSTVAAGQAVTFSGTVTPGVTGHAVYLQAQDASGIGYHVVEVGSVKPDSTYSIPYVLFKTGTKKFRIKVPGDPQNQGVASRLFGVEVTPAPAATLTPETPSNSSQPTEGHF